MEEKNKIISEMKNELTSAQVKIDSNENLIEV